MEPVAARRPGGDGHRYLRLGCAGSKQKFASGRSAVRSGKFAIGEFVEAMPEDGMDLAGAFVLPAVNGAQSIIH
jgi:hypothetical protein